MQRCACKANWFWLVLKTGIRSQKYTLSLLQKKLSFIWGYINININANIIKTLPFLQKLSRIPHSTEKKKKKWCEWIHTRTGTLWNINLWKSLDCFNTSKSRSSGISKLKKKWNALQATKGAFYCGIYFSHQTSIQCNSWELLSPVTAQRHRSGLGNRDL